MGLSSPWPASNLIISLGTIFQIQYKIPLCTPSFIAALFQEPASAQHQMSN